MFDKFVDYMYYLLTTPFKKVKKEINQWHLFLTVIGKWFDECNQDIINARDETMIATCSEEMLEVHAADRGITRYRGETSDNFRMRIANYEEICRMAGSDLGIIIAVKSLGFEVVKIEKAYELYSDKDRWAEFYLIINMNADESMPIMYEILKKNVRRLKEVGAKDNYLFQYKITNSSNPINGFILKNIIEIENEDVFKIHEINRFDNKNQSENKVSVIVIKNLWHFNGSYKFNGEKTFNAVKNKEDL